MTRIMTIRRYIRAKRVLAETSAADDRTLTGPVFAFARSVLAERIRESGRG